MCSAAIFNEVWKTQLFHCVFKAMVRDMKTTIMMTTKCLSVCFGAGWVAFGTEAGKLLSFYPETWFRLSISGTKEWAFRRHSFVRTRNTSWGGEESTNILMSFYSLFIGSDDTTLLLIFLAIRMCSANFFLRFPFLLFPWQSFSSAKRESSLIVRHQLHSVAGFDKT